MKPHRLRAFTVADGVLCVGFLLLALVIGLTVHAKSGGTVTVTVDGKPYGTYSLVTDRVVEINQNGQVNTITIADGLVSVTDANCPDLLCVHQRALSAQHGGSIICLPHRVVIALGDSDLDAVSQ